jgi:hypothetical protein
MTLLMGAVAYDPKVVTIWSGFRTWLTDAGLGGFAAKTASDLKDTVVATGPVDSPQGRGCVVDREQMRAVRIDRHMDRPAVQDDRPLQLRETTGKPKHRT